jgi:hypothetical protein
VMCHQNRFHRSTWFFLRGTGCRDRQLRMLIMLFELSADEEKPGVFKVTRAKWRQCAFDVNRPVPHCCDSAAALAARLRTVTQELTSPTYLNRCFVVTAGTGVPCTGVS